MKKRKVAALIICAAVNICVIGCGDNDLPDGQKSVPYTESIAQNSNKLENQSTIQDHKEIRENIAAFEDIIIGAWRYTQDVYATMDDSDENAVLPDEQQGNSSDETDSNAYSSIVSETGTAYTEINGNVPYFADYEYTTETYYKLSELDELGRCGVAEGCLGKETIADGERGSIGHIRPSGWHTVKYPEIVDGNYLYNRCHLLMWKLSGILDDERNLITGTRYMNVEGMLPFEEQLVEYVETTGNHVIYRVTPDFQEDELVARGVQMEAASVEDQGQGISFNVYCYNIQPGIEIDYLTGESRIMESTKD